MSPDTILRAVQSVNLHNCSYLPLFSEFGTEELVSDGGGVEDVDDEGGVLGGDIAGEVDDELPGVVEGLIVEDCDDVDGAGVTTGGGAFGAGLVDVSRLQPETPSTSPVQSKVTNALLVLIATSTDMETGCP